MPRTQAAATPPAEARPHRTVRTASKKAVRVPSAVPEFDPAAHHTEIAQVAYRNWLERAGSAEEDWLKAEIEVRAKYTR